MVWLHMLVILTTIMYISLFVLLRGRFGHIVDFILCDRDWDEGTRWEVMRGG